MIILRNYNPDSRIDRVWYESSSILYSECDDKKDDFKTLRITFKNGSTYEYKDVDVNDYVFFVHGGTTGSHGKALNEIIKKKKYEYEKIEPLSIDKINEDLKILKEAKETEKKATIIR